MKCLYCHEIIDPTGKFCPKCGLPLNEEVTQADLSVSGLPPQPGWSIGVKPIIALVVASILGAFIGVSVGWLGGRSGTGDATPGQLASPAAQTMPAQVSQPLVPPTTPGAASPPASQLQTPVASASVTPELTAAGAPASAPSDLPAPAVAGNGEPSEPAEPRILTDTEFEAMYADVWAGISPRKRYVPPPPVVAVRPDPIAPSHRLATNPFRQAEPTYITAYWLPTTVQGVSGVNGPGPAEAASQYEQW